MKRFEVRVWEKAEHWYFYATIEAANEAGAMAEARKQYPKRSYSISGIQPIN